MYGIDKLLIDVLTVGNAEKTEPDVVVAVRGRVVVALGRTQVVRVVVPVASSDDSVGRTLDSLHPRIE